MPPRPKPKECARQNLPIMHSLTASYKIMICSQLYFAWFCLVAETNKQPPISIGKKHVQIGINEIPLLFVVHNAFGSRPMGELHRAVDIAWPKAVIERRFPTSQPFH